MHAAKAAKAGLRGESSLHDSGGVIPQFREPLTRRRIFRAPGKNRALVRLLNRHRGRLGSARSGKCIRIGLPGKEAPLN